jgi:hypothetical protein
MPTQADFTYEGIPIRVDDSVQPGMVYMYNSGEWQNIGTSEPAMPTLTPAQRLSEITSVWNNNWANAPDVLIREVQDIYAGMRLNPPDGFPTARPARRAPARRSRNAEFPTKETMNQGYTID